MRSTSRNAFLCLLIFTVLTACVEERCPILYANSDLIPDEDRSGCVVTSPPPEFGFDPFYTKFCSAQGIGIVASEQVDDLALQQAYYIINNMLTPIPEVRDHLVADGHYIAIIGKDQQQTTLPEYSHMDSDYWDARARGLGAARGYVVTSCGEENLLCLKRDRYRGENILVHEFAHTIHLSGLGLSYNLFNSQLSKCYYYARTHGLWENTYAMTNPEEYWAEGIQSFFNTNLSSPFPDGVHSKIDTCKELAEYDPDLFEFIATFYDYFAWEPTCPEKNDVQ
jgi:hypothetical protein